MEYKTTQPWQLVFFVFLERHFMLAIGSMFGLILVVKYGCVRF